jgi:O-antigen ligase
MLHILATALLLLGFLLAGVLGTDTSTLFFWPACAALGLAGLLATVNWRMRVYSAPSDWCLLSVLLFTAYMLARGLSSPVVSYARADVVMILAALVVYVLAATSLSHPKWRMGLFALLVLLLLGNLLIGFIHFSGRWSFHVVPQFARTFSEGRVGGFFNNANHLGAFLSMSVLLMLGLLLFGRAGVIAKLLIGFLCVAALIELRLTLSRAALLGFGIGVVVLCAISLGLLWRKNRHQFMKLVAGGAVIATLGAVVLYQVGAENLQRRMANSPVSEDVRLSIWSSAWMQHQLSPIVGTGARTFIDYGIMLRDPLAPGHQRDPIFAHNEYLQLLADYGWVGMALMALVLVLHLVNGLGFVWWFVQWRFGETGVMQSDSLGLAVGAIAALIAGLVQAVFEFHFHVPALVLLAAFIGGVLMNPGFHLQSHQPRRIPYLRSVSKVMMGFASLALLAAMAKFAPAEYATAQAEIARARSDREDQRYWLQRALKYDGTDAALHYHMGLVQLAEIEQPASERGKQQLEAARQSLSEAVRLNPLHYLHHVALTDVLDIMGREEEGLEAAKMAARVAPQHEEARLALALHYTRFGKFEEAERAFLWVRKASGQNTVQELSWYDHYKGMLKLAELQATRN